jgi:GNAT superfamily N-acetyltransferase
VLSVQAQATLSGVQPLSDRIAVRGRVCFQVLYTQGDLTRIRSIETTCDFTHDLPAPGAAAGMRVDAHASVLDTNGRAGSGRMALEAELSISAQAYECREMEAAAQIDGVMGLCVRRQQISTCVTQVLGEETSLVREEFDLPARLQVDHVLTATGNAVVTDITGGSGRVGVSGTVEVRVLHQADFCDLYLPQWSNALCEKRKELDVLGVGAYDQGKLIGLAGCSADCENMYQIGVDVLPEYRRQGVASALTSRLALEILKLDKVPFYCAAWCNLKSVRNAIKCGFRPAWVELTAREISFVNEMNRR